MELEDSSGEEEDAVVVAEEAEGGGEDSEGEGSGSGSGEGSGDAAEGGEREEFDISLPATHSYMGPGLVAVRTREVVSCGWRGAVPGLARPGAGLLFVGETVPLRLPRAHAAALLACDHRFALLFTDESGVHLSGYGALCETYECSRPGGTGPSAHAPPQEEEEADGGDEGEGALEGALEGGAVTLKARATHRVRLLRCRPRSLPQKLFARPRAVEVEALGEAASTDWLRHVRLPSLRGLPTGQSAVARRMDAALTPWPAFLFDMVDYERLQAEVRGHFAARGLHALPPPAEPLALSVWAARHGALAARERLWLWAAGGALPRLWLTARLLRRKGGARGALLCCAACGTDVASQDHLFAMSSDGAHGHYANPGGYTHDIVTLRRAHRVRMAGAPSREYSWFPGYAWTVCVCAQCHTHLGWRFDAHKRSLRPSRFFGLCRNYMTTMEGRSQSPTEV